MAREYATTKRSNVDIVLSKGGCKMRFKYSKKYLNPSGLPEWPIEPKSIDEFLEKITAVGKPWHGAKVSNNVVGGICLTLGNATATLYSNHSAADAWIGEHRWILTPNNLRALAENGCFWGYRRKRIAPPKRLVKLVKLLCQERSNHEKI